jgi:predicted DNA-binding WGR domain protein
MITKLYGRAPDGSLTYHEAWVRDGEITEHWGRVGTTGDSKVHPLSNRRKERTELARIFAPARRDGFSEIGEDDHATLLVEFLVEGMGAPVDVEKRFRLEARLNRPLGWTGLGHCDGGSTGSGTMEACCLVVDFEVAKQVIQQDLAGTEFRTSHESSTKGLISPAFGPDGASRRG